MPTPGPILRVGHSMPTQLVVSDAEKGETSPRGRHYYPVAAVWSCTGVAAWTGLLLSFFACVMVSILYFNWAGGPLTIPTTVVTARLVHDLSLIHI